MKKLLTLVVVMGAGMLLVACENKGEESGGKEVVARVGDQVITKAEFDAAVNKTRERYKNIGHMQQPAIDSRIQQNVLRRLVDNIMYTNKAKALGIAITDADVNAKFEEHKNRFGGEQAFNEYLNRTHNTVDELRSDIRENLTREKVIDQLAGAVAVTDEEIRKEYEDNKARYVDPEKVRASHILIKINKAEFLDPEKLKALSPEERQKAEEAAELKAKDKARKQAEKVLALVKKKGADFAALAKEYSEDPSKDKGGDLGFFTRNRMAKPFSDAAFTLKPNEISGIVETRFGFHIIKAFEHQAEVQKKFEEVSDQIKQSLESRKKNEARRKVMQDLKNESKVEILLKFDAPAAGMSTMPEIRTMTPGDARPIGPIMPRMPGKVVEGTPPGQPAGAPPVPPGAN
jgi:peptidyl-prolyl cis-trans isomerase C